MFAIIGIESGDLMTLQELPKVGPKTVEYLKKLGINTMEDLVTYYPYRYEFMKISNLNNVSDGEKVILNGVIESNVQITYFKKRMNRLNFRFQTQNRLLYVTIFNRHFLKPHLVLGKEITVIGKLDVKHNQIVASDILLTPLEKEETLGIYHTTDGIKTRQLKTFIDEALKQNLVLDDYIPASIRAHYGFIDKQEAIYELHHPTHKNKLKQALLRTKYEELFVYMLKMNVLKAHKHHEKGIARSFDDKAIQKFIDNLPFSLTKDQLHAIGVIQQDLEKPYVMNRLLQGDVGSGKTVVSMVAMYINYLSGYQSALMAPTEILALQHYENIKDFMKDESIRVALLTGSMKKSEKQKIYQALEDGTIDIIVGTHALISDGVTMKNLGLVITDEQHRFGVGQRSKLKEKGQSPDILYMSATPIPRTYALTIYGDMDVSSIHTMPQGRLPVLTCIKKKSEMKDVLTMVYEELKKGHQAYVVAPLIEDGEGSNLENVEVLEKNFNKAFGKVFRIASLHGKMKDEEKERIMNDFKDNKIQILISTTVIEVGVDVKNATMMVIFDAYRFGLSQLHQLRGRVGRNQEQSYCILISDLEVERLNVLTKTTDGFKVSEEDFKLRGSGDLFGLRQSGDLTFKVANIKQDFNILLRAKEDSSDYLKSDDFKQYADTHIHSLVDSIYHLD